MLLKKQKDAAGRSEHVIQMKAQVVETELLELTEKLLKLILKNSTDTEELM